MEWISTKDRLPEPGQLIVVYEPVHCILRDSYYKDLLNNREYTIHECAKEHEYHICTYLVIEQFERFRSVCNNNMTCDFDPTEQDDTFWLPLPLFEPPMDK